MRKQFFLSIVTVSFLFACSPAKQIGRSAKQNVLDDPALQTAHVGISVYEPATGKYLFNFQGDKYFVPASNTKIPTCYAAMKYLGDSLVGARLSVADDAAVEIYPSADPTFLHPDFAYQPLLKEITRFKTIRWNSTNWQSKRWGSGWSWNDYDASYMAERSPFPIYGNVIKFFLSGDTLKSTSKNLPVQFPIPDSVFKYNKETRTVGSKMFSLDRAIDDNQFYVTPSRSLFTTGEFPFRADFGFISKLLEDTLKADNVSTFSIAPKYNSNPLKKIIHSQPTDSLLKPMMHRSDNFFAEQSLLMVSNERLGMMNEAKIIDTLLKTDFKNLPQKPRWVDGSGLSRYNLFTPQDMVAILNKMQTEFGMDRLKEIFPAGNEGTLTNYYNAGKGYLFAKTGTLSGVVAISGFLYTKHNKLLIFSVLVNNHQASATAVRRAVEKFIEGVREKF
jgi:serine-type D-Ala-D-Ala carboxypeptidase/endopeptidase (penicillin-binding protein 4)